MKYPEAMLIIPKIHIKEVDTMFGKGKKKLKLYGESISPSCKYCVNGDISADGLTVSCLKKGVVSVNESCRRFEYDPLKRQPRRAPELPSFSSEDFKL